MKPTAKLFVCLGLAFGMNAQAASVTYSLNQSNVLPDNIGYVKVTISDSETFKGDIDFKVETTSAFNNLGPLASNFGITAFGFNPDSSINFASSNIVGLASGWTTGSNINLDGFGNFLITENGQNKTSQNPLTFSIRNDNDSIESYTNYPSGNTGSWNGSGAAYFAAHVVGFNYQDSTSAYFAGNTLISAPVPAAAWLLGSGLIGLVGIARRKDTARSA